MAVLGGMYPYKAKVRGTSVASSFQKTRTKPDQGGLLPCCELRGSPSSVQSAEQTVDIMFATETETDYSTETKHTTIHHGRLTMNASIPLEEVLPFTPRIARKVLVCDSLETDGRFVCYTFVKQASIATCSVLWLLGTPVTEQQVATGLKKMGCDAGASYLREGPLVSAGGNKNLTIRSLASEIAASALEVKEGENWSEEAFLKNIYQQAKKWILEKLELASATDAPCWVILDDMSALSTILSESLVYQFVDTLIALVTRLGKMDQIGILIRVSHELDQSLLNQSEEEFAKDQSGWVGAGGLAHRLARRQEQQDWIPWERSLLESMDGVVDVLPLTSGISREAHGRLIFSEVPSGRGWSELNSSNANSAGSAWNKLLFNYCIHDNGVKAIRLRVQ